MRVHSEDHVRAHVFQCVLSCHVERHRRRDLAPILFEDVDRATCWARNLVERFFGRIKEFRRIATRYGKTVRNFLSAVHLAVSRFLLRRIANQLCESTAWQGCQDRHHGCLASGKGADADGVSCKRLNAERPMHCRQAVRGRKGGGRPDSPCEQSRESGRV